MPQTQNLGFVGRRGVRTPRVDGVGRDASALARLVCHCVFEHRCRCVWPANGPLWVRGDPDHRYRDDEEDLVP